MRVSMRSSMDNPDVMYIFFWAKKKKDRALFVHNEGEKQRVRTASHDKPHNESTVKRWPFDLSRYARRVLSR